MYFLNNSSLYIFPKPAHFKFCNKNTAYSNNHMAKFAIFGWNKHSFCSDKHQKSAFLVNFL